MPYFEGYELPAECGGDPFNMIGKKVLIRVRNAPGYHEVMFGGEVVGFSAVSDPSEEVRYPFSLITTCSAPQEPSLELYWDKGKSCWIVWQFREDTNSKEITVEFRD